MGGKRVTLQDAHNLAESRGFKFLSQEFKKTDTKHLWGCGQGHKWSTRYDNIKQGQGCPDCAGRKPKTIQDAHILAESRGFKFLSQEFKNTGTKHLWECGQGHKWSMRYDNIKQGQGCPDCANLKRTYTIQNAHNLAESRGFKFLSPVFESRETKHLWGCGQGHEWMATFRDIKEGSGCTHCVGLAKKTIQDAHILAESRGFKFLSQEFKNTNTKYLWGCGQGHKWSMRYNNIRKGQGCPDCAGLKPKTIKDAHILAQSKGYKFLSPEFKNTNTKHLWDCGKGHEWMATFQGIQSGSGCLHCANLQRTYTIQDAHNLAESKGIKFLSPEFKGTASKYRYLWGCGQGHEWYAGYSVIKAGQGCPDCSDKSIKEKLTRYCFERMLIGDFKKTRPDWLRNPKTGRKLELDGFNEHMGVAFEHQGIQHETDCPTSNMFYRPEQLIRDEIKRQKCKEQGITLIEVPEIGRRLKIKNVVPFLLSEFDKHNIAYPESAKSFQIDMKEFYALMRNS